MMNFLGMVPNPLTGIPQVLSLAAEAANPREQLLKDQVAEDFEGTFLSLLFKEMRQTLEEGTLFADDKSDVLGGMFDIFMGQHLAAAGGLGIAAMVRRYLTELPTPSAVPAAKKLQIKSASDV
ncbi:MAG: hypothetical protein KatS3mg105_4856 [Gemmatales bacterium]|nr:MAG: hypothetical protein KatS3mg105_4856 [Gemmatales bacterium]